MFSLLLVVLNEFNIWILILKKEAIQQNCVITNIKTNLILSSLMLAKWMSFRKMVQIMTEY